MANPFDETSDSDSREPQSDDSFTLNILQPGFRISQYELSERLGVGGMGMVFRASDTTIDREVALKIIRPDREWTKERKSRFLYEAKLASKLDDPNIVTVYQAGEESSLLFLAMKLVEGGNLKSRAHEFSGSVRKTAKLIQTVSRAMGVAHVNSVIHRDLKPDNILIDHDGQPLITDFGLAKESDVVPAHSMEGVVLGSIGYMSPEQADGRHNITSASDIYSIGVVFYELLTGKRPIETQSVYEYLRRVATEIPKAPNLVNAQVDQDLSAICLKCLETDPARRYQTGDQLAEELQRWLNGEPVRARIASRPERFWKWCRRRPAAAALIAVVFSSICALAVTGWVLNSVNQKTLQKLANSEKEQRGVLNQFFRDVLKDETLQMPQVKETQTKLLNRYADYMQTWIERNKNDLTLAQDLAVARFGIITADVAKKKLTPKEEVVAWDEAIDYFNKLLNHDPSNVQVDHLLLNAQTVKAIALGNSGQREKSRALLEKTIDEFNSLIKKNPESIMLKVDSGIATINLIAYSTREEREDLIGRAQTAVVDLEKAYEDSGNVNAQMNLGRALNNLGLIQLHTKEYQSAKDNLHRSFLLTLDLIGRFPRNSTFKLDAITTTGNLCDALRKSGKPNQALDFAKLAIKLARQDVRSNGDQPLAVYQLVMTNRLAGVICHDELKDMELAADFFKASYENGNSFWFEFEPDDIQMKANVAYVYRDYGMILQIIGKFEESLEPLQRAADFCREAYQNRDTVIYNPKDLAHIFETTLEHIAIALQRIDRDDERKKILDERKSHPAINDY